MSKAPKGDGKQPRGGGAGKKPGDKDAKGPSGARPPKGYGGRGGAAGKSPGTGPSAPPPPAPPRDDNT